MRLGRSVSGKLGNSEKVSSEIGHPHFCPGYHGYWSPQMTIIMVHLNLGLVVSLKLPVTYGCFTGACHIMHPASNKNIRKLKVICGKGSPHMWTLMSAVTDDCCTLIVHSL